MLTRVEWSPCTGSHWQDASGAQKMAASAAISRGKFLLHLISLAPWYGGYVVIP